MKRDKIGKVHIEVMQWLQANGRKGGRANTPAQLAARQRNAKLGGRPKKNTR